MLCSTVVICFFFFLALTAAPVDALPDPAKAIEYVNKTSAFNIYSRVDVKEAKQIVVLGVGTAMQVSDYSSLANNILNKIPNILVAILDHNLNWIDKRDPDLFVNAVNGIFDWLKTKFNVKAEGLQWYVGGHSASGMAAAQALYNTETSAPKRKKFYPEIKFQGYIGVDPVADKSISRNPGLQLRIPSLVWGKEFWDTCVNVLAHYSDSGVGFYANARSPATSSTGVVHHLISFNDSKSGHCIYSNAGCGFGPLHCFDEKVAPTAWNNVGDSIRRFLQGESIVAYANSLHKQCISKKNGPCA
eukprot:gene5512-6069_t